MAGRKRKPAPKKSAPMVPGTIILPKPPSVNGLFRNVTARDGKRGGRVPTKQYAAWKIAAGAELQAARMPKIAGGYELTLQLGRRKGSDLDNYAKGVSDLFVAHRIVTDDSLCERITLEWADDLSSKQCRVSIRAALKPGTYAEQTEAGEQISLVPPLDPPAPPKRGRASARIVAARKLGPELMGKLHDFAAGKKVSFSEAEESALEEAGLAFVHETESGRWLILTAAGWAMIEGPSEEEARELSR